MTRHIWCYRSLSVQNCSSNIKSGNRGLQPGLWVSYTGHPGGGMCPGNMQGAIKDILISHPQFVKIRYTSTTVDTIRQAWEKWERSVLLKLYPIYSSCCANGALSRFCSMPEIFEIYGTSDPTRLCRDPTSSLVRAFLYWVLPMARSRGWTPSFPTVGTGQWQ